MRSLFFKTFDRNTCIQGNYNNENHISEEYKEVNIHEKYSKKYTQKFNIRFNINVPYVLYNLKRFPNVILIF